jgi:hypothetical protein
VGASHSLGDGERTYFSLGWGSQWVLRSQGSSLLSICVSSRGRTASGLVLG